MKTMNIILPLWKFIVTEEKKENEEKMEEAWWKK